jgi:hypothetical protein
LRYLKKFNKKSIRQKLDAEYLDQIDAILERYDLKNVSLKSIERKKSLQQWMDSEQKKNGVRPNIPQAIIDNLETVSYKELTMEQFRGLNASVKEIEYFGRFKKELIATKKKREIAAAVGDIQASLEEHNDMGHADRPYSPTLAETVKDKAAGMASALFNIEMLFRKLDGDKLGALSNNIFAPLSEASDKAFTRKSGVAKEYRELITSLYSKEELMRFSGLGARRYEVTGKGTFTKENIVSMALNYGNEGGRDRLSSDFTDAQITQALSYLEEKDAKLIQSIWSTFDENLWPDLAALEREFHSEAPEKVEAIPFTVGGVELTGGYYPLKYDPKRGNQEKIIDERMSLDDFTSGNSGNATTKQGHAKARQQHLDASLRLDLGVFAEGVSDTIHDIEMRRAVIDAYRIINNKEFSASFKSAAGSNAYELLDPWLRDIAVPPEGPKGGINRTIAMFRSNTAIVGMGLSIKTALLNITGYFQSFDADDVGAGRIAKHAGKFFLNPLSMKKTQEFVFEKSEYMTSRANTFDRDVRQNLKKMSAKGALTPEGFSWYYLIALTDKGVTIPTWMAAYERKMKDSNNNELESIRFADHIIRTTQGGGRDIDLSEIQRGLKDNRELYKAFTMFYSYFNATLNRNIRSMKLLKEKGITDIPRFIASFVFLNIMPAVISAYLAGYGPEDDEDEKAWATAETVKFMFGQVPFVRDIAGVAIDKITGQYSFPYRATPVVSAAEQAVMGPMKIISDFASEEVDEKTLKQAILTGGVWLGLPSRQMWRTTEHLIHVESGESTTANITLSGEQTVDSVAIVTGDRVLVKNQTNAVENGIYVASTGSWTRDIDFNGSRDVVSGTRVFINSGGQARQIWTVTTTGSITPGTTSLSFELSIVDLTDIIRVPGITAMKALSPTNLQMYWLDYHTSVGDLGGGWFRAVTGAPATTYTALYDDGFYIKPDSDTDGSSAYIRESSIITPQMFGAKADGLTNDTVSIQAAINYSATIEAYSVHFPKGHYIVSTLRTYYDAALNPGYPSGTYGSGRMSLNGVRPADFASTVFASESFGTFIETTSTTSSAIITGTSALNSVRVEVKDMAIVGNSSGDVLLVDGSPQFSNFENLLVRNAGAGTAINVKNGCWTSSFRNIYATCEDTGTGSRGAGTAFQTGTCGLSVFDNITASFSTKGCNFGTSAEPFGASNVLTAIQSTRCRDGIEIFGGEATTVNGVWCEQGNGAFDFKVAGRSRRTTITGLYCVSTDLTLGSLILGDNTGTPADDDCTGVVLNTPSFGFVGAAGNYGIIKYASCGAVTINHPSFKNNGGIAIGIDTSGTITPTIVNFPDWYPQGAASTMPVGLRVQSLVGGNTQQQYLAQLNTQENESSVISGETTTAITNAVDNGAGLIRITSALHLLTTGDYTHIASVAGTTEANGEWEVIVIDANTFDLVGSAFTNPYVSGGTSLKYALNLSKFQLCPETFGTNTTGGSVYIRLPSTGGDGTVLSVYKQFAANNVVFTTSGNIDGASSVTVSAVSSKTLRKVRSGTWTVIA